MINRRQKGLVHIYADAAGISGPTYRNLLQSKAGVASCADPALTQAGFDALMAALETMLFARVDAGDVPNPIGRIRHINDPYYWRNRCPTRGQINSRQLHRIEQLWTRLKEWLPDDHCSKDYLMRIAHKSIGRSVEGLHQLRSREAAHLIDALTDRLSYAIRNEPQTHNIPF